MLLRLSRMTGLCLGLVLLAPGPGRAEEPSVEHGLQANARKLIDYVKEREWASVGVLKFQVRIGDGPARSLGTLGQSLANRLEAALILELRPDDLLVAGRKVKRDIITRASEAAATDRTLNHLTEAGRMAFFNLDPSPFRPAWGRPNETVKPEGFFTGEAVISPDMKTVTVRVKAFGHDQLALAEVCSFTANTDLRTLREVGLTTSSRGSAFDPLDLQKRISQKQQQDQKLVQITTEAQDQAREDEWLEEADRLLAELKNSPVKLTPLYDDKPTEVEINPLRSAGDRDNVLLRIATPQPNQSVAFKLENTSPDTTYAVVLKINGKNSIFQEEKEARDCYKWILNPGKSVTIRGFQMGFDERAAFVVLPPERSEADTIYYGNNAGILQMVVFKEAKTEQELEAFEKSKQEEKEAETDVKAQELGVISRGVEDAARMIKPFQLAALQRQLKAKLLEDQKAGGKGRGLLGVGDTERNPVTEEKDLKLLPLPVLDVAIRYYKR